MKTKLILVLATNNKGKIDELKQLLEGFSIELKSLKDIGCTIDLPETGYTFAANAIQKAQYIFDHFGLNCIADDSGLEVDVLNGAPGVYSARYAGLQRNDSDNIRKLLMELNGKSNRKANFRTVICLIVDGKQVLFEGVVNGVITNQIVGDKGFGYDPVFIPEGYTQTFAQMGLSEKNKISHRAMAVKKLVNYLHNL